MTVTVQGTLRYPCPAPPGVQSGRQIDDEHWRKVAAIFPIEHHPPVSLDDTSETFVVNLSNGRYAKPNFDKEGFLLLDGVPTAVADFADAAQVESTYFEEVQESVTRALASSTKTPKAAAIVPFHWLVRDSQRDNYDSTKGPSTFGGQSHAPVSRVHGDYTIENGPLRFRELQAKGLLPASWDVNTAHWGIINVWKNVSPTPITELPLAVLDVSTVDAPSVFQYWLCSNEKIGRNLAISYDPNHRWMYFPKMKQDEALMFFTHEQGTTSPSSCRKVFHTAFDDPSVTKQPGNPRVSIETRCLVVFDPRSDD